MGNLHVGSKHCHDATQWHQWQPMQRSEVYLCAWCAMAVKLMALIHALYEPSAVGPGPVTEWLSTRVLLVPRLRWLLFFRPPHLILVLVALLALP